MKLKTIEMITKKIGDLANKFEINLKKCKFGNFGISFKLKKEFDKEQDTVVRELFLKACEIEKIKINDKFRIGFVDVDYSVNKVYFFMER